MDTGNLFGRTAASAPFAFLFATLLFAVLTLLAATGLADAADETLLRLLQPVFDAIRGHAWLDDVMRDASAIGGFPVLVLTVVSAAIAFALCGRRREAVAIAATALAAQLSIEIVKTLFNRDRPGTGTEITDVFARGFPSGHTTEATAIFLTLALLIATLNIKQELKTLAVGIAVAASFLVGASRLYLDLHWPSDVAAGWALGAAWAYFAAQAVRNYATTPGR
jgi:undecaprenyl-diphosphatase